MLMRKANSDSKDQTDIFSSEIPKIQKSSSQQEVGLLLATLWQKRIKAELKSDFSSLFPTKKTYFTPSKSKHLTFLKPIFTSQGKKLLVLSLEESRLRTMTSLQKLNFISAEFQLWSRIL